MPMNRKSFDYNELIDAFGEKKIKERYSTLYEYLESFIKKRNYTKNVVIADSVVNQVVVDYFSDVYRLKEFHKIDNINFLKIHSYTAYWLLRRKPLQIVKDNDDDVELAFVNENFVTSYLLQFLYSKHEDVIILPDDRQDYFEFVKNLEYFLRYRIVTAQMIETILESYKAGIAFHKAVDYTEVLT